MNIVIIVTLWLVVASQPAASAETTNDFQDMINQLSKNPTQEAAKRTGYGADSLQPYYVCDSSNKKSALPLSAWHYSCKQSCTDDQTKTHINITRVIWRYMGKDLDTYKVSTNKVCYTSHENIWGYCSQTQTITPVDTTQEDKGKIPPGIIDGKSGLKGVKTIINSHEAPCEYMSDNTVCARDYVITYRPGKLSKKSDSDPMVLNIYGDGVRTDPHSGQLIQNEVAWFWNPPSADHDIEECGWYLSDDTTCKFTNTSDIIYCPDIGYQYILKDLKKSKTCKGEIYDIDGPAPFLFLSQEQQASRKETATKASEGKGEPDINLIKGINSALTNIEETYCSSSCDLFARGSPSDDNSVLNTPIGTWRLINATSQSPKLSPCYPTATWRIKSPTHMCHGKNHILVEDSKTKHTCSWDTTKDYIIVDDLCSNSNAEAEEDHNNLRRSMSENKEIEVSFWTGDRIVMSPPYTSPRWESSPTNVSRNPSWFSKVELNSGMLHNKEDVSRLLTTMMESTKQEISYTPTSNKTIKSFLVEEVVTGLGDAAGSLFLSVGAILGGIPKFIILVMMLILGIWSLKMLIELWMYKRSKRVAEKGVRFSNLLLDPVGEPDFPKYAEEPPAKRRAKSRSRQLAGLISDL